jgi:transposase-like protein
MSRAASRLLPAKSSGARFIVVSSDVYFRVTARSGGVDLPEKSVVSPDELLSVLKRYLKESGDTEQAVASQIGVNHHTLHRWLSDKQSPKKGKLALTAVFLRRAGRL